jgi:mono/diheme cytochrome c family protein
LAVQAQSRPVPPVEEDALSSMPQLAGNRQSNRGGGVIRSYSLLFSGLLLLVGAALPLAAQTTPVDNAAPDGRALFLAACAACHGVDGRGTASVLRGFEEEPPDFTDCSFASREPAADWVAIAHQGGPVRAFSPMMPSFGDALTLAELEQVVGYVVSLCMNRAWPRGELNLPRPIVTEKAFPEDEAVLETSLALEGTGAVQHAVVYEKRFGPRTQLELVVPFGYRRAEPVADSPGSWASGLGDIGIGFKQVLTHGLRTGHILSAVAEIKLPTGDTANGFGSGATTVEGFLAFGQILPADAFLQLQAGAERLTGSGGETEIFWSGVFGRSFAAGGGWGRTWSPMVEVVGRWEDEIPTRWQLVPQLHVTLSTRQHVMLSIGSRLSLGPEREPAALALSLIWDWYDGGLLEGW